MARILVAGLIYIETETHVDAFPVEYSAVRFPPQGVQTSISGKSYHIAQRLVSLHNDVELMSCIGGDPLGHMVQQSLEKAGVSTRRLATCLGQTQQSIVLVDAEGQRQFFVDLKDIERASYPLELWSNASPGVDLVVLCDTRFSDLISDQLALVDEPVILYVDRALDHDEELNRRLFSCVDVLFAPVERLPLPPEQWIRHIRDDHHPRIVVVSLGSQGALIWVRQDNFIERIAAIDSRVNLNQKSEDLLASFVHELACSVEPYQALENALNLESNPECAGGTSEFEERLKEKDAAQGELRTSL